MKINKIIVSGRSGCGKSSIIRVLQNAMESRGYGPRRIQFVERRDSSKPCIKFDSQQGMNDFVALLCKCAGEHVGEIDECNRSEQLKRIGIALSVPLAISDRE